MSLQETLAKYLLAVNRSAKAVNVSGSILALWDPPLLSKWYIGEHPQMYLYYVLTKGVSLAALGRCLIARYRLVAELGLDTADHPALKATLAPNAVLSTQYIAEQLNLNRKMWKYIPDEGAWHDPRDICIMEAFPGRAREFGQSLVATKGNVSELVLALRAELIWADVQEDVRKVVFGVCPLWFTVSANDGLQYLPGVKEAVSELARGPIGERCAGLARDTELAHALPDCTIPPLLSVAEVTLVAVNIMMTKHELMRITTIILSSRGMARLRRVLQVVNERGLSLCHQLNPDAEEDARILHGCILGISHLVYGVMEHDPAGKAHYERWLYLGRFRSSSYTPAYLLGVKLYEEAMQEKTHVPDEERILRLADGVSALTAEHPQELHKLLGADWLT